METDLKSITDNILGNLRVVEREEPAEHLEPWSWRENGHEGGRGIGRRLAEEIQPGRLRMTPALRRLRAALSDGRTPVVLAGDVGLGKSVAAARAVADAPDAAASGQHARFVSADDVCDWIHRNPRDLGPREWTAKQLSECEFLAIDEMGREYLDAHGRHLHALTRIIERRHEAGLPTVLTTNMDQSRFEQQYGGRVVDRIIGSGAWIQLTGKSMRREKK